MTRPGNKTFSGSFSVETPLMPFSPSGVAVEWVAPEGGVGGAPLGLDKDARVGLGTPGDAELVRESNCWYKD
jgi:hypothetical protein